jgi:hypothetical protein
MAIFDVRPPESRYSTQRNILLAVTFRMVNACPLYLQKADIRHSVGMSALRGLAYSAVAREFGGGRSPNYQSLFKIEMPTYPLCLCVVE